MKVSDIPWKQGGGYGAVAYFVSYIFAATFFYLDHLGTQLQYSDASTTESIALITTIFHNGPFVGTQLGGGESLLSPDAPLCGPMTCLEFFGADQGMLFVPAYHVIPPLVLLGIGALVAYTVEPKDRLEALLTGASLALGFVVVMLAVVLIFRFGVGFSIDPVMAVVAGIAYPVVFGSIGALVGNELVGATASSGTATS